MASTMFERYGGFARVSRIVSAFYDKVLDSPILAPYFAGVDMKNLVDHQSKFIAQLMGGPVHYSNEALERAHDRLNIDDRSFQEMLALLRETFEEFEVDERDIAAIEADVRSLVRYIVRR